jgi:hypothetical protein
MMRGPEMHRCLYLVVGHIWKRNFGFVSISFFCYRKRWCRGGRSRNVGLLREMLDIARSCNVLDGNGWQMRWLDITAFTSIQTRPPWW